MAKEMGSTHSAASAMRQSKAKRPMATSVVETMAPASSGMKWEKLCSRNVQSAMIVLVKSARSFFPKKERGILRSRSASAMRRTPLSTYVAKYVALYCQYVVSRIRAAHAAQPAAQSAAALPCTPPAIRPRTSA